VESFPDDTTVVDPISELQDDVNLFGVLASRGPRRRNRRRADTVPPTQESHTTWIMSGRPKDKKNIQTIGTFKYLVGGASNMRMGECTGVGQIKIYGNKWGALYAPGFTISDLCDHSSFGGDPNPRNHKGCWCSDTTCKEGYAFDNLGNCGVVTVTGDWRKVGNVPSTVWRTTTYGMSYSGSSYQASASYSASMKTKSSGFSLMGISGGSSYNVKANAELGYRASFSHMHYNQTRIEYAQYFSTNGSYLFQFWWLVKVGDVIMNTAQEDYLVQADVEPRCLPSMNLNDDYSRCTPELVKKDAICAGTTGGVDGARGYDYHSLETCSRAVVENPDCSLSFYYPEHGGQCMCALQGEGGFCRSTISSNGWNVYRITT